MGHLTAVYEGSLNSGSNKLSRHSSVNYIKDRFSSHLHCTTSMVFKGKKNVEIALPLMRIFFFKLSM